MVEFCEKKGLKAYNAVTMKGPSSDVAADLRRRLLPKVFVVLAPQGRNFSKNVASAICIGPKQKSGTSNGLGKLTLVDAEALTRRGGHSAEIEEELAKLTLLPEEAPGKPTPVNPMIWTKLFQEFFAKSADPLGNFVVINYPSSATAFPTPRDLFDVLESVASLEGFISVSFQSNISLAELSLQGDAADEYKRFAAKVLDFVVMQYDADGKLVQLELDDEDCQISGVCELVVSEFHKTFADG